MINLFLILTFISLYGLSIIGDRKGVVFFTLGLLLHFGYLVYRAIHLGWLPVTERHDILLVMAFSVALGFFYLKKKVSLNMLLNTLPLFVVILSFFAVFLCAYNLSDTGIFLLYGQCYSRNRLPERKICHS
jgi:hypothetical protein